MYLCRWETAARVALCNDPLGDRYGSTEVPETRVRQQSIRRHLNVERPSTPVRWTPSPRNWPRRVVTASLVPVLQTTCNERSHVKCDVWNMTLDALNALLYKLSTAVSNFYIACWESWETSLSIIIRPPMSVGRSYILPSCYLFYLTSNPPDRQLTPVKNIPEVGP